MIKSANRWLCAGPLSGWQAVLLACAAVSTPTIIRLAVNGIVTGCEFTPYLPFVFISAITLRWWAAGAVTLAAVAIMGGLFSGPLSAGLTCFRESAAIFLASSALMIGLAAFVRHTITSLQRRGDDESKGGIVFSLERGEVWASWYGQASPTLLGSHRKVSEMMWDFLKQQEVADRLSGKEPK